MSGFMEALILNYDSLITCGLIITEYHALIITDNTLSFIDA